MHNVFLGVQKKLMTLWFDSEYNSYSFSLHPFIGIINSRIKNIKLPSFVPRIPRKVEDYGHWKANELKLFLLVYSLAMLKDLMQEQYFNHHMLLVQSISLLNSSSVSENMIKESRRLLNEYVKQFEVLYGKKHLTCNLHLLRHLADEVIKFGPLWTVTCFIFENLNGILKSFVHGTRYAELQIYSSVKTYLCMPILKQKILQPNTEVFKFCQKIEKSGVFKYKLKPLGEKIFAIGAFKNIKILPVDKLNILKNYVQIPEQSKFYVFTKLLKNTIYIETESYSKKKKDKLFLR